MRKLTALIIMDGYGLSAEKAGNAIGENGSPYIKYLLQYYPDTSLNASGIAVGLPEGQMGNSEVGHLNLGAGRVVYQDLVRINAAIEDESFFSNAALLTACREAKERKKRLHLLGLVSNGGVHSHMEHLYALLELAKREGLSDVLVHVVCDGRDAPPQSALGFVRELEAKIIQIGVGRIATVCGRYYMMDRDKRWDRVQKAFELLANGEGTQYASAETCLEASYAAGITDEFVLPAVIVSENSKNTAQIRNGDSVIFFNYRSDRGREICRALTDTEFESFPTNRRPQNLCFVTMTSYDQTFTFPVAFAEQRLDNTLGEYLSACGLTQLRAAETEKYAHVTFFFNGGAETPFPGESRLLIDSPRVATYDLQPEMSARAVCERVIGELEKDKHDVLILNFANCDMVGHTGNYDAAVKAVAAVDDCVRRLVEYILSRGGTALITADHGNAEQMFAEDGSPHTAHTCSKVPLILVGAFAAGKKFKSGGSLCDIAPTLLYCMDLPKPPQMTGKCLIKTPKP